MIHTLVYGWIAGMAALFLEIIIATLFFTSATTSLPFDEKIFPILFPLLIGTALIEETVKYIALRNAFNQNIPSFKNALTNGVLIGIGFALFEACMKIVFHETQSVLLAAAISSIVVHGTTGGILGISFFFRTHHTFFSLFFLTAFTLHVAYNIFLSSHLATLFSQ